MIIIGHPNQSINEIVYAQYVELCVCHVMLFLFIKEKPV